MGRNAVQDALQLVGASCVRGHFGEALAEECVQNAEILADVDVDLVQVLQKIVHKLHKILFALEASEIGQRLQSLGD